MTTLADKLLMDQIANQEIIVADLEREYLQAQKVADAAEERLKAGQSVLRSAKQALKNSEAPSK